MTETWGALFKRAFMRATGLQSQRSVFQGASIDRLTQSWKASILGANETLRYDLPTMVARSRDLAINNDHVRRYLSLLDTNIVGPHGLKLQMKVRNRQGRLNRKVNKEIEALWAEWSKAENASVTGKHSWWDLERIILKSIVRDGDVLVRMVKGFDNPFQFSLQLIEHEWLDVSLNKVLPSGNRIIMGVEQNIWGRPVAYHVVNSHPSDVLAGRPAPQHGRERIPADEIIHPFVADRSDQARGVPWVFAAMYRLKKLGAYEDAELIAAEVSAEKMGFFKSAEGTGYQGQGQDATGAIISESRAGSFEQLPAGVDFVPWSPDHPAGNFGPFTKALLRSLAMGLNVSYSSLSGDLSDVNFSSIRTGVLDERDGYRITQLWLSRNLHCHVFAGFLSMQNLSGQLPFSSNSNFSKLNCPSWQGRGWSWVNPVDDVNASTDALDYTLTTRSQILGERGLNLEEILEETKAEQELADELGVELVSGDASESDNQQNTEPAPTKEPIT
jgi:lambda family phage portal protein